jgi:hypothetical protein
MRGFDRSWALLAVAFALASCAAPEVSREAPDKGAGGNGAGDDDGNNGSGGGPSFMISDAGAPSPVERCTGGKCSDFPAAPIITAGAPPDAPARFGGNAQGDGPCLLEPESGSLFPQQWLRPRIKWSGATGLHRITIHADLEDHDLVAYTTDSSWQMPKDIWTKLAAHVVDSDIVVTVRAAGGGESVSKFQIAPVAATGSMVFWAVEPGEVGRDVTGTDDDYASELQGFSVGEESTVPVLTIRQAKQQSRDENGPRRVRCIGCHAATPDDGFVGFVDDWPWNLAIAGVKPTNVGMPLPGLSAGGLAALDLPWGGMMAFSKAEWRAGHRLVVLASSLQDYQNPGEDNAAPGRLVWYNLDSPAPAANPDDPTAPALVTPGVQVGEVAREGDARGAACPAWTSDGSRIVYSSTMGGNLDGALMLGTTDLYTVPFNDGKGGMATPLAGAADPAWEEYYPAISPDDQLVSYTRVPQGERMYANKLAELAVVRAVGGTSLRLAANDPPACSGKSSPGINNHWGKWAPAVQTSPSDGRRFYWLLFSSNRADIPPVERRYPDPNDTGEAQVHVTQLYMTVVVDDGHELKSYPAIYLWNQSTSTLNTTPIWENLSIPRVVE